MMIKMAILIESEQTWRRKKCNRYGLPWRSWGLHVMLIKDCSRPLPDNNPEWAIELLMTVLYYNCDLVHLYYDLMILILIIKIFIIINNSFNIIMHDGM